MFFQKTLAQIVQFMTTVFRLSYDISSAPAGDDALCDKTYQYWYTFGPRVLVLRKGKLVRLTGLFSVLLTRDGRNEFKSCKFFIFTLEPEDEVFYGDEAQVKYRELYPPRDPNIPPMFTDGSTAWG